MPMPPKVSVVIPVYNGAQYLDVAIDSALAQTYPNVEVLVVNDGSTDAGATEAVALSYGERIRYLAKPNGGVASALNAGIDAMTGEYFSWLSHDDVYCADKIADQVAAFDAKDPREIVYSNYDFIDANGDSLGSSNLTNLRYDEFLLNLIEDYPINGCTCLIPRDAFTVVGKFDVNLRITQDYAWWFSACQVGYRFKLLNRVLVHSRQHDAQDSKNLSAQHLSEVNRLYVDYVDKLTLADFDSQQRYTKPQDWYDSIKASLDARGLVDAAQYVTCVRGALGAAEKPRVLVVGMFFSIHMRRWMTNLLGSGIEVHCFPSMDWGQPVSEIFSAPMIQNADFHLHGFGDGDQRVVFPYLHHERVEKDRAIILQLLGVVNRVRPHVIHALEMQQAGYLVQQCQREAGEGFPPWLYTNYGSDLYACPRQAKHREHVARVLASATYYSCECHRDVQLARRYGFSGRVAGVVSNVGGFDLEHCGSLRGAGPTSSRNVIALKGYQHEYGRALVGLKALQLCAEDLRRMGMQVVIYSAQASPAVPIAAELFTEATGVATRLVPYTLDHSEILRVHASARISIGLSISDGVSVSFLEAMAMGSFPIQSFTACADEWVENGRTGYLVDPEDPHDVAAAIKSALTDDKLVDEASKINAAIIAERLDLEAVRQQIVTMYRRSLRVVDIYGARGHASGLKEAATRRGVSSEGPAEGHPRGVFEPMKRWISRSAFRLRFFFGPKLNAVASSILPLQLKQFLRRLISAGASRLRGAARHVRR